MAYVRKTLLSGLTWLTAVATLLAGLPRIQCVCASSQETPSPARAVPEVQGCCCCKNHSPGQASSCTQGACCGHYSKPSMVETREVPGIGPTKCTRGLIQSGQDAVAADPTQTKDLVSSAAVLYLTPVVQVPPVASAVEFSPTHSLSPPVDLVNLLKHLLI